MQFFLVAATFFTAIMATPMMEPSTTTVGQAASNCGVNSKLSCCNGEDSQSCSVIEEPDVLNLLPIDQACQSNSFPACCETDDQTGLINLNVQCNNILNDVLRK